MGNAASVAPAVALVSGVKFVIGALRDLAAMFAEKPQESNDTMLKVQANAEREERERRVDEDRRLEEEREHLQLQRQEAEERARESQEREHAARHREEAALLAADEARLQEAAAKRREEAALAEAEHATNALHQGIRPIVWPSKAQFDDAKARIQYDPEKLHFAVCGTSGSGKSSLINAFRGLANNVEGAAPVGVTETTSEVTRHPDPRNEIPYSRLVWYDIPGAGTPSVPDWQYFNDQGLFVFDFIVMAYDVRFTKIDVGIIENCNRFKIPLFVVRSKADQHIANMVQDLTDSAPGDDDYDATYLDMKLKYVDATRSDFLNHMLAMAESSEEAHDRELLLNQCVYIVSSVNLRSLLQTSQKRQGKAVNKSCNTMIDEGMLVEEMLKAAAGRRYTPRTVKAWHDKRGFRILGYGSTEGARDDCWKDVDTPSISPASAQAYLMTLEASCALD